MEDPTAITAAAIAAFTLTAALRELINQRRQIKAAKLEARTDDMTGCRNKRDWRERTEGLQAAGESFTFVLFDVANLKAANEALGHAAADEILREIASEIRHDEQPGHRIGGDEFVVALSNGDRSAAEALRDRIEKRVGYRELAPGVGMFIAGAVGEWTPGADLAAELTAADFALERRKAAKKAKLGRPLTPSR